MGFMLRAGRRHPSSSPTTSSTPRSTAREADRRRPDPAVHRQRVRPGPASTATSSPARPGPATSSRCSSTTRTSSSCSRCPRRGGTLWSDNMLVPNKAAAQGERREADELLLRARGRRELAAWVNYICPVEGAKEEMEKIDPTLVDNPLIFPDRRRSWPRPRCSGRLDQDEETQYHGAFQTGDRATDGRRRTDAARARPAPRRA